MKKKPTKLEAKVASLEKKITALEKLYFVQLTASAPPKEPETFEDCVKAHRQSWSLDYLGTPCESHPEFVSNCLITGQGTPSEKRAKQLAAIAKMMTVADALNGEHVTDGIGLDAWEAGVRTTGSYQMVSFKTEALARKAIKILGEETIKTAFGL